MSKQDGFSHFSRDLPVLFGSAQNVQTSKNGTFKNVLEVTYSIIEDVRPPHPEGYMHELMSVKPDFPYKIQNLPLSPDEKSKSNLTSQTPFPLTILCTHTCLHVHAEGRKKGVWWFSGPSGMLVVRDACDKRADNHKDGACLFHMVICVARNETFFE